MNPKLLAQHAPLEVWDLPAMTQWLPEATAEKSP